MRLLNTFLKKNKDKGTCAQTTGLRLMIKGGANSRENRTNSGVL